MKALKNAHTSPMKKGMGDYHGSAVRNRIGRPIDVFSEKAPKSKGLKKPPKSLA